MCDYCCEFVDPEFYEEDENSSYEIATLRNMEDGLVGMSPRGISEVTAVPEVVTLFRKYDEYLEESDVGHSRKALLLDDPDYPSNPDSDCEALTPVYRGGQNGVLSFLAKFGPNHTPTNSSYPGATPVADWDGVTIMSPFISSSSTQGELDAHRAAWSDWLFPARSHYVRGLNQLYYATMPFADVDKPTVKEFEDWSLIVLNHARKLLGAPPIVFDQKLFLRSQWSDERKFLDIWDAKYPDGTCVVGSSLHCGETFVPSLVDEQKLYWNDYKCGYPNVETNPLVTHVNGSAASLVLWNGTAMTNMSRTLAMLWRDGNLTGHAGPFFGRSLYGFSVHGPGLRGKFGGNLYGPPNGMVM